MRTKRTARWVWMIVLAVLTVLIFSQSLMNSADSSRESAAVQSFLKRLLGEGVVGTFFYRCIRKVAHFTEYALLGCVWGAYDRLYAPPRWLLPAAGALTAVVDECLQFLSPGRTPKLTDALLDCGGYICGAALGYLLLWLYRRCRRKPIERCRIPARSRKEARKHG